MSTILHAHQVRRLRKILQWSIDGFEITKEEAREGLKILAPQKKSDKAKAFKGALRARKSTKIAAHQMTTAEIRAFDMKRADGACECGCRRIFDGTWWNTPEMDHFAGGSGRKKQKQSIKNTWILVRWCDRERTRNWPDAATWNRKFREHCERYGYPVLSHIEHKPLPRRGPA